FLKECKRVLKPGGVLVVDESNEYPHVPFVSTKYVSSLKNEIRGNQQVADRYTEAPPRVFRANPWSYWGCSTDHFWIFNFKGLRSLLSSDFSVDDFGAIGSYLSNNGTVNAFPMFYSLNFGSIVDMFVDYKALPGWYQKLTGKLFIDTGVYIYSVCIA
ncbi:class I SAM-dependent methyltransferase, partial [Aduncisulcus paluster]